MALRNRTIDFRLEGIRFANFNPTPDSGQALTSATRATFLATEAAFLLFDNDFGGVITQGAETGQKQIFPDQLWLKVITAGTGLISLKYAVYIDSVNRFSSGGTLVNANSFNMDMRDSKGTPVGSIVNLYTGPITLTATSTARPAGRGVFRQGAPVVGDQYIIDFGSVAGYHNPTLSGTNPIAQSFPVPFITIGPEQSIIIYIWGVGMTAAPTFEYGMIWLES